MGKVLDSLFVALGLSGIVLGTVASGGALGALLSLRAAPSGSRLVAFFSAWAASFCLTPLVAAYFEWQRPVMLLGASFLLGMYAIALLDELTTLIKSGAARQWFSTVIARKLGG